MVFKSFSRNSITKRQLEIKTFLTSKRKGSLTRNIKRITSFIIKQTILLENLFQPALVKGLMGTGLSKDIKNIQILMNKRIFSYRKISK